jgi:hypothetical protein
VASGLAYGPPHNLESADNHQNSWRHYRPNGIQPDKHASNYPLRDAGRQRYRVEFNPAEGSNRHEQSHIVAPEKRGYQIDDQAEFVRWWREAVRSPGGKEAQAIGADRGQLVRDDAEILSGITHQQVSRWAKLLKDRSAYRAKLFGKAYAAAMACKADTVRGTEGTGANERFVMSSRCPA